MRSHFTRRIPMAVAVALALAVLALGFPASANPGAPTPVGHEWSQVENHGTSGAPIDTYWLGTPGNQALELRVNNARALRLEPRETSPNVIGGYSGNAVTSAVQGATISGGGWPSGFLSSPNRVTDQFGTVAGGQANRAGNDAGDQYDALAATVGGGIVNSATGRYSTIGGGAANQATLEAATVGGGSSNLASGANSTVGGGLSNEASSDYATVAGGNNNTASGANATIGGGGTASEPNQVTADLGTVGGGEGNTVDGSRGTVCGGDSNHAGAGAVAGGGWSNDAAGQDSMVPGGYDNTASGMFSFAAGYQAQATHQGSFVWSSVESTSSYNPNTFTVRSHNGATFYTASGTGTGVVLASGGGSWSSLSDRSVKANFSSVDGQDILDRLASIPIETWNLKSQDESIRHIGPTAQDFYEAFGVGEDDKHITTVDADGVALAAIQGLYELSQGQAARIQALQEENASLNQRLDSLETRVTALEGGPDGNAAVSRTSSSGLPAMWLILGGGLALVVVGLALAQRRLAGARR